MRRVIIATVLIPTAFMVAVAYASVLVNTQTYQVQVLEAIVVDDQVVTEIEIRPGETQEVVVTITNFADNPLPVEIDASILPAEGILITDPGSISVPADSLPHDYPVGLTADVGIALGVRELTIEIKR